MNFSIVKTFILFGVAFLHGVVEHAEGSQPAPASLAYHVTVKVADEFGAGTDADVYVVLYGSNSQCERRLDSNDNDFERGSERTYPVDCGQDLGWVATIRIGHRNGMWIRGDDWKVSWVRVQDPYRQRTDTYTCNCWLEGEAAHRDLSIQLHGGWGDWSAWGACSVTCGSGSQTRTRTCNNPPPTNGGNPCQGSSTDSQSCKDRECPVNGGWGDWTPWTECSATCGPGTSTRRRQCNNPPPAHGGQDCQGPDTDSQECNLGACAVDGGWGAWSDWGPCSVSCGDGVKSRNRTCDSPPPSNGGRDCDGPDSETVNCTNGPCPVDGGWSSWSQWRCDAEPCQIGIGWRNRSCTNPPPQHGGKDCEGPSYEEINCTLPCLAGHRAKPEEPRGEAGGSRWGAWSPCSATCGQGTQRRHLECRTLASFLRGGCPRGRYQTRMCNAVPCAKE